MALKIIKDKIEIIKGDKKRIINAVFFIFIISFGIKNHTIKCGLFVIHNHQIRLIVDLVDMFLRILLRLLHQNRHQLVQNHLELLR